MRGGEHNIMSDYQDKIIECQDCGKEFIFSAAGQSFFEKKGFTDPKRCKDCRERNKLKKERRQEGGER